MEAIAMKSSYRRSGCCGVLFALIATGALGCAPAVNIGDLPQASSGGTTSGGSASGDPPASGQACGAVTTLASLDTLPGPMALAGDSLYLIADDPPPQVSPQMGHIVKVPLAGGAPIVLASDQPELRNIAANATRVYWITRDGVKSMPVGGGPVTVIAAAQYFLAGLALDATSVYWGDGGRVMKAPLAGGASTALFTADATGVAGIGHLAVDAESVYWSAEVGPSLGGGVVMKAPIGGGAATTLVSGLSDGGAVAVDAEDLYWTDIVTLRADGTQDPGTVWKQPLDGSSGPVTIATLFNPNALAVDGTAVYWGGGSLDPSVNGAIFPSDVGVDSSSGAGPKTILSSVTAEGGLVACPGGACWTDAATKTVMRFVACTP